MTISLVDADSLLAIDIGSVNTKAVLFDVVDGRYRFLASAVVPTTAQAPYRDVREGVRLALDQLKAVTGRVLVGEDEELITPTQSDGAGVDKCVVTMSAGLPLKLLAVGLLEDVSVGSVLQLAATTYAQVLDTFSLSDRRKPSARLESFMRLRPDVVVIAGGTEGGASKSVMALQEPVERGCNLLPKGQRPDVLFVGNQILAEQVKATLGPLTTLHFAPNIRPALDEEQLTPAHFKLSEVYCKVRGKQIRGIQELEKWSGGHFLPSATAFGRTIRFISKDFARTRKGVLGIDVGASSTIIATGYAGDLSLNVQAGLGLGESLPALLMDTSLEKIARWVHLEVSENDIHSYIYNKASHPASLPVTPEETAIEHALACETIRAAIKKASQNFPVALRNRPGYMSWFEPIFASGSVFTGAPSYAHSLLMLLNALQPAGVTTFALDQNNLAASLGAAAEINPLLVVQSLDAHNFINLGMVISPAGRAAMGTPVLRARVTYEDGHEVNFEAKFGALEVIPLPAGQPAKIQLQPLHRFDVGLGGPGRSGTLKVKGGVLGLVIDARGRPLALPENLAQRRELIKKWLWSLGI